MPRAGSAANSAARFVPETLIPALDELTEAYDAAKADPEFWREFHHYADRYVGRPTPLYFAEQMTKELGGAQNLLEARRLSPYRRAQN